MKFFALFEAIGNQNMASSHRVMFTEFYWSLPKIVRIWTWDFFKIFNAESSASFICFVLWNRYSCSIDSFLSMTHCKLNSLDLQCLTSCSNLVSLPKICIHFKTEADWSRPRHSLKSSNRLWKKLNLPSVLLGKVEWVELTELGLPAVHLKECMTAISQCKFLCIHSSAERRLLEEFQIYWNQSCDG